MAVQLHQVVPVGRTFDEYQKIFKVPYKLQKGGNQMLCVVQPVAIASS